ncbi:hypothetical protein EST62_12135 [Chlorobaculum sp. 24CR]|uniref:hypothetical protein n=1 Tax=Chlorobaculum sp. 24CR TaxID=2508878 RepID=UPI00100A4434|nr:hypothetical protein [Chlorobaculum sp. 24CR]RXK81134.1 hypothetical protein EST62_12135 [Chlorobaculum sp. 24CR]
MKHPRNRILSALHPAILILAAIFLAGCSKPTEEAIIGKWEEEGKAGEFIEFFHDKTFLISTGKEQLSGKWTKVGEDRIKADITTLGTTVTMLFEEIRISGNQMTGTLYVGGERSRFAMKR